MEIIDLLELLYSCNVKKCCVVIHSVATGHVHKFSNNTKLVLDVFVECLAGSCIVVSYSFDKSKSYANIECVK